MEAASQTTAVQEATAEKPMVEDAAAKETGGEVTASRPVKKPSPSISVIHANIQAKVKGPGKVKRARKGKGKGNGKGTENAVPADTRYVYVAESGWNDDQIFVFANKDDAIKFREEKLDGGRVTKARVFMSFEEAENQ